MGDISHATEEMNQRSVGAAEQFFSRIGAYRDFRMRLGGEQSVLASCDARPGICGRRIGQR